MMVECHCNDHFDGAEAEITVEISHDMHVEMQIEHQTGQPLCVPLYGQVAAVCRFPCVQFEMETGVVRVEVVSMRDFSQLTRLLHRHVPVSFVETPKRKEVELGPLFMNGKMPLAELVEEYNSCPVFQKFCLRIEQFYGDMLPGPLEHTPAKAEQGVPIDDNRIIWTDHNQKSITSGSIHGMNTPRFSMQERVIVFHEGEYACAIVRRVLHAVHCSSKFLYWVHFMGWPQSHDDLVPESLLYASHATDILPKRQNSVPTTNSSAKLVRFLLKKTRIERLAIVEA